MYHPVQMKIDKEPCPSPFHGCMRGQDVGERGGGGGGGAGKLNLV